MVNLLKDLVKMPEKAGKNGPPEVQKYQKVSLSLPPPWGGGHRM